MEINNKVIGIGLLVLFAGFVMALADNELSNAVDDPAVINASAGSLDLHMSSNFMIKSGGYMVFLPDGEDIGGDYFNVSSDGTNPAIAVHGGGNLEIKTDGGLIMFEADDPSDYAYVGNNGANIPIIGVAGGTDLYFQQSGGAFITVHADAFTEHTNPYSGNIIEAYLDITDWLELKHPARFRNERSETPFNGTDLGRAGKALGMIVIRQKQEINDLKQRLNTIEQTLCNQGASKYC